MATSQQPPQGTSPYTNIPMPQNEEKENTMIPKTHGLITDFIQVEMRLDSFVKGNIRCKSLVRSRINAARLSVMIAERRMKKFAGQLNGTLSTMDEKEMRWKTRKLENLDQMLQNCKKIVKNFKEAREVFREAGKWIQFARTSCAGFKERLVTTLLSRSGRHDLSQWDKAIFTLKANMKELDRVEEAYADWLKDEAKSNAALDVADEDDSDWDDEISSDSDDEFGQ